MARESGLKDVGAIARYLQQSVGGSKLPEKLCKFRFCDGKGFISAYRENDNLKAETLFSCKCNEKSMIGVWNDQPGWIITRGRYEN